jgi:hypothetical protein
MSDASEDGLDPAYVADDTRYHSDYRAFQYELATPQEIPSARANVPDALPSGESTTTITSSRDSSSVSVGSTADALPPGGSATSRDDSSESGKRPDGLSPGDPSSVGEVNQQDAPPPGELTTPGCPGIKEEPDSHLTPLKPELATPKSHSLSGQEHDAADALSPGEIASTAECPPVKGSRDGLDTLAHVCGELATTPPRHPSVDGGSGAGALSPGEIAPTPTYPGNDDQTDTLAPGGPATPRHAGYGFTNGGYDWVNARSSGEPSPTPRYSQYPSAMSIKYEAADEEVEEEEEEDLDMLEELIRRSEGVPGQLV